MILRIWHGWTIPEKADRYELLLKKEIFKEISNKKIEGYNGIQLLRRKVENEVEFITLMMFDSMDCIIAFSGKDYEKAYVPESAKKFFKRYDKRSQHYEVRFTEL